MAIDSLVVGAVSGTGADVNTERQLKVIQETDAYGKGEFVGASRSMGEFDAGSVTGVTLLRPLEVDADYRLRASQDVMLDEEVFNYTSQNTGKHSYNTVNITNSWAAGQMTTNSASATTTGSGTQFETYASFPCFGATTLSLDFEVAFSAQPVTNTLIEWGVGIPATATVAPSDGVFFRLTSAGLQGVASFNGTETNTGVFPLADGTGTWVYTNNKRYQFIVYQSAVEAIFWVNDGTGAVILGRIPLPTAQPRMMMSPSGRMFHKHRIAGGAASGAFQTFLGAYNVRLGGTNAVATPTTQGNRVLGSYQGLAGGTMGTLATYPNSTNPTAAAPSNTALTANLPAGLGGQGAVTAAAASATDGIWGEYAVPALSATNSNRRLCIRGLKLSLVNLGAAVATTATTIQFSLAFGHTAVNLATAEAATAKAPRRIAIGIATWAVGAGIGAMPQCGDITLDLGDAPVFVNPGERVALVGKFLAGTATASQVINFVWQPVYGWE